MVDFEEKETHLDGRETWVSTTKLVRTDKQGKTLGTLGISRDITKRKQAEEELAETNRALEEATARAESANKAKSDFLANMSHEIRTPMNGVIGMTDLLLDTRLNQDQRRYAETVRASGEALLDSSTTSSISPRSRRASSSWRRSTSMCVPCSTTSRSCWRGAPRTRGSNSSAPLRPTCRPTSAAIRVACVKCS